MEIPALQGLKLEPGLRTMESPLGLRERHKAFRIGVPREVANEERRVALSPGGVTALVAYGNEVFVETEAGLQAHFPDNEYDEAGATIASSPEDLYSNCSLSSRSGRPAATNSTCSRKNRRSSRPSTSG